MSWNATPDRPLVLLYDGTCRFCVAGAKRLSKYARPGVIRMVSSRDESEVAKLPPDVRGRMSRTLQLVSPDGQIATGAGAINRALATRPIWRLVTWIYWVPGVKQVTDWLYSIVARNRYKIMGRVETCESGACAVPSAEAGAGLRPDAR